MKEILAQTAGRLVEGIFKTIEKVGIRRAYPETISKEQFYRIAHISKATALHLLQNGLVPCKDTGKKTRRYTIRTDDVRNSVLIEHDPPHFDRPSF